MGWMGYTPDSTNYKSTASGANNYRDLACSVMITTDNDEDDNKCDTNQEVMVKRAAGT